MNFLGGELYILSLSAVVQIRGVDWGLPATPCQDTFAGTCLQQDHPMLWLLTWTGF